MHLNSLLADSRKIPPFTYQLFVVAASQLAFGSLIEEAQSPMFSVLFLVFHCVLSLPFC